jgi:acyl-CoA synthetase (AMP-forming)/AMP-acid ligase II
MTTAYRLKRHQIIQEKIGDHLFRSLKGRPRNLVELLQKTVTECPQKEGFVSGDRRWTFGELGDKVGRFSRALQNRFGAKKGDRIALLMETDIEYPLSFFGIVSSGGIAVPLNNRFSGEELVYEINNSVSSIVIMDDVFWEVLGPFKQQLTSVKHFIVRGSEIPQGTWPFSALLEEAAEKTPVVEVTEQDVAMLMYTSGTTGYPKGAMQTHRGIILACMLIDDIFESRPETDRMLNVLPMFHAAGTIMTSFAAIYMKVPCVYLRKFKTEKVLEILEREKISLMVHVPTIYWLLANHSDFDRYDLKSFRVGITGGAPKSHETFELLRKKMPWARFVDTFGLTETHTLDFILDHEEMASHMSAVGRVVPIEDVRIVDKKGSFCGPGAPGEILIKGPKIVLGYWNNPEGTREAIHDGWLHTGDFGKIDENGYVYVLDRIKDMINRGGENIYSVEVENAISRNLKIAETAVIGVPDKVFGEVVKAYVILRKGEKMTEVELQEHCKQHLADYKIPKYVEFVEDLPRNQTGKIMKKALRASHDK